MCVHTPASLTIKVGIMYTQQATTATDSADCRRKIEVKPERVDRLSLLSLVKLHATCQHSRKQIKTHKRLQRKQFLFGQDKIKCKFSAYIIAFR